MLTTRASGLLFTLKVLTGNPKGPTLVPEALSSLEPAKAPAALAFDGCFASTDNRDIAKLAGVKELSFSKNRSIDLSELLLSPKRHRALGNSRAGVGDCYSFQN